jgi:hypothetical protein
MIDRGEALDSIRKALALLDRRLAENPGHGVHIHAAEQLARMLAELDRPYMPPEPEREWVDVGLMAVKELDDVDPEFANALMKADYEFKRAK